MSCSINNWKKVLEHFDHLNIGQSNTQICKLTKTCKVHVALRGMFQNTITRNVSTCNTESRFLFSQQRCNFISKS